MTEIADKPFTQLLNLNLLDELRIQGILVSPSGGQDINVITSGDYDQQIVDDIIIITGAATVSLVQASTGIKQIAIKSKLPGGDVTITPFSGDTVNGTTTLVLSAGTSTVIAPITLDWEVVG